jgi:hypothetical protein
MTTETRLMSEAVKLVKNQQKELEKTLKLYVINKEIPLQERWDVFVESELGKAHPWIQHFKSIKIVEDWMYSDFNKYETYQTKDLVERLQENIGNDMGPLDEVTQELVDAFKEEILEKFLKSFQFDW